MVCVESEENVTQKTLCQLLHKVRYQSGTLPVTVVLDNAAYNRSRKVKSLAKRLKIDLEYLPPYSPNLNLIERYWKFLKSECLNTKFYECFEGFKSAISGVIQKTKLSQSLRDKLKSLITINFQTFKNELMKAA